MHDRIEEIITQAGIPPVRMNTEEKIHAVHMLSEDGVLTMKGGGCRGGRNARHIRPYLLKKEIG